MQKLLAHIRWQPAIPAIAVMLMMVMLPLSVLGTGEVSRLLQIMIPIGIVLSCSLAVAAGFCSFAPQIIWGALAGICLSGLGDTAAPDFFSQLLLLGCAAVVIMIVVQFWRVRTGRFVATVNEDHVERE